MLGIVWLVVPAVPVSRRSGVDHHARGSVVHNSKEYVSFDESVGSNKGIRILDSQDDVALFEVAAPLAGDMFGGFVTFSVASALALLDAPAAAVGEAGVDACRLHERRRQPKCTRLSPT